MNMNNEAHKVFHKYVPSTFGSFTKCQNANCQNTSLSMIYLRFWHLVVGFYLNFQSCKHLNQHFFFKNISQFFLALFCNFLHYYSSSASYHHHYIFHSWYGYGMLTENFLTQLCSRPKVFPGGKCKFVTSKLPTNLSLKQCLIGSMIDSHLPRKCNLKSQRLKNMS